MDRFDRDLRALEYRSDLKLPSEQDRAVDLLKKEVHRLNELTASSQTAFFKMYQSLLAKKKETEQLGKHIADLHHEASKLKTDADRAQAKLIFERDSLDDECKSLKSNVEVMKNEQAKLRENHSNALNDNKRLKSDIAQLEDRLAAQRKELEAQLRRKEELEALLTGKHRTISDLERKAFDARESADQRVADMKEALLETQQELAYQKQVHQLAKQQAEDLRLERDKQTDLLRDKDAFIDRLREEIAALHRGLGLASPKRELAEKRDFEEASQKEFARLRQLTDELRDAQVEVERLKLEGSLKDKEYLKLKDQLAGLQDARVAALKQSDVLRYENSRLKEEQAAFVADLASVRGMFEAQIEAFALKLHASAEALVVARAKLADVEKENALLKLRAEDWKRRAVKNELELEELLNEKLRDANKHHKPHRELAQPRRADELLESHEFSESVGKSVVHRLRNKTSDQRDRELWTDESQRLDWDGLLFKLNGIGSRLT